TNIRLSHLMVLKDLHGRTNLIILRGRISRHGKLGSYIAGEAPVFMKNLPSARAVSEAKDTDDLRKLFGPQHGFTHAWGGDRIHWTQGWTWFTQEGKERLRFLSVFAHVSSVDGNRPGDIDVLRVTEGVFRPANPRSASERRQFKTGEQIQAEYEADRRRAR